MTIQETKKISIDTQKMYSASYSTVLNFDNNKQLADHTITTDQAFSLGSGTHVPGFSIVVAVNGNGINNISWPTTWVQFGNLNLAKTNYLLFTYMANGNVWVYISQRIGDPGVITTVGGTQFLMDGTIADGFVISAGKVVQVSDLSGNNNHGTQFTTNTQGTYDSTNKLLQFTNAQYYNLPSSIALPGTGWAIFFTVNRAVDRVERIVSTSSSSYLRFTAVPQLIVVGATASATFTTGTYTGKKTFAILYDGANAKLYINGTLTQTIAVTGLSTSFTAIGASPAPTQYFNGGMYYLQLINRAITETERTTIETDMKTKFSVY